MFACAAAKKPNVAMPKIDVKIYQGWPDAGAIVREQDNERIACTDPKFLQYHCMTQADFNKLIDAYILGCKEWK
jgi:hypothetical protein